MNLMANPYAYAPIANWGAILSLREPAMKKKPVFFVPKSNLTEYLLPAVIGHNKATGDDTTYQKPAESQQHADGSALPVTNPEHCSIANGVVRGNAVQRPSLSPDLRDFLLGKSPLRLIVAFEVAEWDKHLRLETLECGHELFTREQWDWDGGRLNWRGWPEKRRRCHECKQAFKDNAMPPKKPSQSIGRQKKEKTA